MVNFSLSEKYRIENLLYEKINIFNGFRFASFGWQKCFNSLEIAFFPMNWRLLTPCVFYTYRISPCGFSKGGHMAPPLTIRRVENSITHQPLIFIKKSAKSLCNRLLYNIEVKEYSKRDFTTSENFGKNSFGIDCTDTEI